MGQYKISIYFKVQIGIMLELDKEFFTIRLPFFDILYGRLPNAHGYYFGR